MLINESPKLSHLFQNTLVSPYILFLGICCILIAEEPLNSYPIASHVVIAMNIFVALGHDSVVAKGMKRHKCTLHVHFLFIT